MAEGPNGSYTERFHPGSHPPPCMSGILTRLLKLRPGSDKRAMRAAISKAGRDAEGVRDEILRSFIFYGAVIVQSGRYYVDADQLQRYADACKQGECLEPRDASSFVPSSRKRRAVPVDTGKPVAPPEDQKNPPVGAGADKPPTNDGDDMPEGKDFPEQGKDNNKPPKPAESYLRRYLLWMLPEDVDPFMYLMAHARRPSCIGSDEERIAVPKANRRSLPVGVTPEGLEDLADRLIRAGLMIRMDGVHEDFVHGCAWIVHPERELDYHDMPKDGPWKSNITQDQLGFLKALVKDYCPEDGYTRDSFFAFIKAYNDRYGTNLNPETMRVKYISRDGTLPVFKGGGKTVNSSGGVICFGKKRDDGKVPYTVSPPGFGLLEFHVSGTTMDHNLHRKKKGGKKSPDNKPPVPPPAPPARAVGDEVVDVTVVLPRPAAPPEEHAAEQPLYKRLFRMPTAEELEGLSEQQLQVLEDWVEDTLPGLVSRLHEDVAVELARREEEREAAQKRKQEIEEARQALQALEAAEAKRREEERRRQAESDAQLAALRAQLEALSSSS